MYPFSSNLIMKQFFLPILCFIIIVSLDVKARVFLTIFSIVQNPFDVWINCPSN